MYELKDYMSYTVMIMQQYHETSFRGANIICRNYISLFTPKRFYKHIINISDNYVVTDDEDDVEYSGWNKDFVKTNIIGWLNENTKGRYFIVLFNRLEDGYIKDETRDRIHFYNKQDAATFKLYFK